MTQTALAEVGQEVEEINLNELARRCLAAANNSARATDLMVAACHENPAVMAAVMGSALRYRCQLFISKAASDDRQAAEGTAQYTRPVAVTSLADWGEAVVAGLADTFRLPSGKLLGDATRDELYTVAHGYSAQSASLLVRSRWLRAIAAELPDGLTSVRKVVTEDRLAALRAAALIIPEGA